MGTESKRFIVYGFMKYSPWLLLEPVVEYLVPALCVHCKLHRRVDEYLCAECRSIGFPQRERGIYPQDFVYCLHLLNPVVRSLVHALKYKSMQGVAAYLVKSANPLGWQPWQNAAWIPVPVHPARLRERGYNQAECIARALRACAGGHVFTGVLKRARYRSSQTHLESDARRWNAAGCFRARAPVPHEVILVDDVFTTGSTTGACEAALLRVGVERVQVVTLAFEPKKNGARDFALDQQTWGV